MAFIYQLLLSRKWAVVLKIGQESVHPYARASRNNLQLRRRQPDGERGCGIEVNLEGHTRQGAATNSVVGGFQCSGHKGWITCVTTPQISKVCSSVTSSG